MASKGVNCGVYLIEHLESGRRYVGSAVLLKKRWKEHLRQLTENRHHSRFLQRAWNKYGESAFRFSVILYCDKPNLLMYEQALIDFYSPEYNSAPTAGSQLGFRHSPESRAKLSIAAKRTRNFTGHKHTEETKRRISQSRIGKGGGPMSADRRAKIGAAHKGRVVTEEQRRKISATLTGTSTGRGSLSEDQVREVRRLRESGLGKIRIGKSMGISIHAADAVIGRHAYLWVK